MTERDTKPRYRTEINPKFADNMLILAIPGMLSHEEALCWLLKQPKLYSDDFFKLPLHIRLEALEELQEIFIALDRHAEGFITLLQLTRWSYSHRNPNSPEVMRTIYNQAARNTHLGLTRQSTGGGGAIGLVLKGISGCGKTSFIDRFTDYFPQKLIIHEQLNGMPCRWPQIPYLRVQCPPKASLKGFGESLLQQIDKLLNTRHAGGLKRLSLTEILLRVSTYCSSYFVGIVIVDDLQNLRGGQLESAAMLNFFCNFMEETGIPLFLCGTNGIRDILESDIKSLSKLSAKGMLEFKRLEENSDDWSLLVEGLWAYSILEHRPPMPKNLPSMLYFHTQGVARFLREMMVIVHQRMAVHKLTDVNEELLVDISKTELLKYQAAISFLRRHTAGVTVTREAHKYEDLLPDNNSLKILNADIRKRSEAATKKEGSPKYANESDKKAGLLTPAVVSIIKNQARTKNLKRSKAPETEITEAKDPYEKCRELGWLGSHVLELG